MILAIVFCLNFLSSAQAVEPMVVNQVLFEMNQEVWTHYDYQQFLKAKNQVSLNVNFLKQPKDDMELFILTRILFYQITRSMSGSESTQYNLASKYKDQNESLNIEVRRLKMIVENEDSKYQQLISKEKYDLWVNYMKKKYNYNPQ